jgi:hypothetical protein
MNREPIFIALIWTIDILASKHIAVIQEVYVAFKATSKEVFFYHPVVAGYEGRRELGLRSFGIH